MELVKSAVPEELRSLGRLISSFTPHDGTFSSSVPGVHLVRNSGTHRSLIHGVTKPCLCLVAQGAKSTHIGTEIYQYDEAKMLAYSIDVPVAAQVVRASPSAPFLCIRIDIDAQRMAELAMKVFPKGPVNSGDKGAAHVANADLEIIEAASRLLRSTSRPDEIPLLGPIIIDEILMRLLLGPLGGKVAQIGHPQSPLHRINKAIVWLRGHFAEAIEVDELAASVHMSASTFYQHFKAVTSLSPLQYQKALRLQEARRLLVTATHDANGASKAVGYVSASQFNREYARMFGETPVRDLMRLRNHAVLHQSAY
jgi:AraC-like DNA-binding protein